MGYVYSGLWFLIAILLFVRFRGEGKVVYVLSGYFVIMGIWWLINQMVQIDLMSGVYGWVFRGISALMLVVLVVTYIYDRKIRISESDETSDAGEDM